MTSTAINDFSGINNYPGSKAKGTKNNDLLDGLAGSFQNAIDLASNQSGSDELTQRDVVGFVEEPNGNTFDAKKQTLSYVGSQGKRLSDSLNSSVKTEETRTTETESSSKTKKDDTVTSKNDKKVNTTDKSEHNEKVDEAADKTEDKVVKEIAEKLNVSEEEVREAMETLGLTVMDLLDQSNMALLVTELTANGDMSAMLTNEDLFASIVDLTDDITQIVQETVSELSEDLGISFDDTMKLLEDAIETKGEAVISDEKPTEEIASKEAPVIEIDVKEKVNEEEHLVHTKTTSEAPTQTEVSRVTSGQLSQNSENQNNTGNEMDNSQAAVLNQVNQNETATPVTADTQFVADTQVSTQEIIDQIADYVKVTNNSELSEIEMTLNPASLGNIHLQVTEKNGIITATISAQNESVRDALMLQAMTLKEELNEQGLKVEAVDVTVASHEFEENNQGENGENAKEFFEKQLQKSNRRRIMINGLSDAEALMESEELSDAEKVQIDMMTRNGQSMDVMA